MADEEDKLDDEIKEGSESEDGEDGEAGEDGEGKKGSKKKLLMIAVPILLLVGGGAGAYFTGMLDSLLGVEKPLEEGEHAKGDHEEGDDHGGKKKSKKKDKKKGDKKKSKDGKGGDYGEGEESAFLAIPTIMVNLNTEDGTPRYLRLTVQLEMEDASDKDAVKEIIPRVIDQFQTYLRELRVRDLRGSAGIYRLQMELLWRVNQATAPIEIKDVLFQEILIQ